MPKDAAFWQFLYLIFAKMHDERAEGVTRRFYAQPTEPFTTEGRKAIRTRIEPLFEEVKQKYGPVSDNPIFRGNEEITLSDRALGFLVAELARYDFARTDIDAKGVAYQELVGTNLRGDRGQYFTPRGAISLMVEMLDPQEDERVLDPHAARAVFCARHSSTCSSAGSKQKALRVTLILQRTSSPIKNGSPSLPMTTSSALISTRSWCVLPA